MPNTKERNKRIKAAYQSGKSIREVAAAENIAYATVRDVLIHAAVPMRGHGDGRTGVSADWNRTIDIEAVKKMYVEEGKSTLEIAFKFGYSPAGIRQALVAAGVSMRSRKAAAEHRSQEAFGGLSPTREWCEQALAAFSGNASACAAHYNFNYQTFIDLLKRLGVERQRPGRRLNVPPPFDLEEAAKLSSQGVPYRVLAEKYGVTSARIHYWLAKTGHEAPRGKQKSVYGPRTIVPSKRGVLDELMQLGYYPCEICGPTKHHFDMAHIMEDRNGGPLAAVNILLLCPNHHRAFDQGTLPKEEFAHIASRVRAAEKELNFVLTAYDGW